MGNPLRVLHVVVNMNRGGAETLIMNLYRNIDRKKVQFDFLTCKPGVFDMEIKKMGGRVYRIPYISDVGHFQYVKGLDDFFLEHKEYDIVHSHLDKMSGLVLRSAKKAGVRVRIAHSHSTNSEGGIFSRTYKWYFGKLVVKNSTHNFACSKKAAKWLFDSNKVRFIKNGIELEKFIVSSNLRNQVKQELKINHDTFVLGHVGRFSKVKNHSFIIDVFQRYNKINRNSVLVLIGDGPLKPHIKEKVRRLNLETKVFFLGVRNDINNLLQSFDTFIFPSYYEGLGISVIEAQGAGVKCLVSDQVPPEVDLGVELVDFLSLEDINKWVQKLQSNKIKEIPKTELQKAITNQGYDITITAKEIEELYITFTG